MAITDDIGVNSLITGQPITSVSTQIGGPNNGKRAVTYLDPTASLMSGRAVPIGPSIGFDPGSPLPPPPAPVSGMNPLFAGPNSGPGVAASFGGPGSASGPGGAPYGSGYSPSLDPSLGVTQLLAPLQASMSASQKAVDASNADISGTVQNLINPQLPILKQQIDANTAGQVADYTSDMGRRGIAASSTDNLGIAKIRGASNQAYSQGVAQLLQGALPVAQQQQAAKVQALQQQASQMMQAGQYGMSLRNLFTNEQFQSMTLQQKADLNASDQALQTKLAYLNQQFQASMQGAQMAWQTAQNDADRKVAQQQFDYLQQQHKQQQFGAIMSSLGSLVGMGIGMAAGGPVGAVAGGMMGNQVGNVFWVP